MWSRLKRNDARMVRLMGNARPQDMISAEKVRARLKLNSMRECLQDRRLSVGNDYVLSIKHISWVSIFLNEFKSFQW